MPPKIVTKSSLKTFILPAIILFTAFGCASTYKPVSVVALPYNESQSIGDTLRVAYRYNVQEITDNKRYGVKEKNHNLATVAIKIENTSSVPIRITPKTFKIYSGTIEKTAVSPFRYAELIKQHVGAHMLHALWGPWGISYSEDTYGGTHVRGYYIPVGLIVGIGNAVRASRANKECKATLESYEIWNKEVAPGETLYSLVIINSDGQEPLKFKYDGSARSDEKAITQSLDMTTLNKVNSKSLPFDFFIIPDSGKSYSVNSRIYIANSGDFVVKNDGGERKAIYPSDTKTLSRITKDGRQLLGIPQGNHWLFKIVSGRINAYYFLADENTRDISHIQKDNGEIVDFTRQELILMADGDHEVIDMIDGGKYLDAIQLYNAKVR